MLARVVHTLSERHPGIRFDFLVPLHAREDRGLAPLLKCPAVTWHAGLNDEALRSLYQQAYLLLLPMSFSGANNSIVEALATGLPIVTTDVGGIRDYGGGTIYPVVANNDDRAAVALVEAYLEDPAWRNAISEKCRAFAVRELSWSLVAQKHIDIYSYFM